MYDVMSLQIQISEKSLDPEVDLVCGFKSHSGPHVQIVGCF